MLENLDFSLLSLSLSLTQSREKTQADIFGNFSYRYSVTIVENCVQEITGTFSVDRKYMYQCKRKRKEKSTE